MNHIGPFPVSRKLELGKPVSTGNNSPVSRSTAACRLPETGAARKKPATKPLPQAKTNAANNVRCCAIAPSNSLNVREEQGPALAESQIVGTNRAFIRQ